MNSGFVIHDVRQIKHRVKRRWERSHYIRWCHTFHVIMTIYGTQPDINKKFKKKKNKQPKRIKSFVIADNTRST